MRELLEQLCALALPLEVAAHRLGLVHVPHDQVSTTRMSCDLTGGGLRLFMEVLAVDDGGVAVLGIRVDPLPHIQHRAAGGIHQHTADLPQPREVLHRHAEGRQNHHVRHGHVAEVELAAVRTEQELHAHGAQLRVDVRIVDDLAHQEGAAVGELGPGLVGVLDRPVHPVAKAELTRHPEGDVAHRQRVVVRADGVDHAAVVVGRESTLDGALEPESFAKVGLLHPINLAAYRVRRVRRRAPAGPANHRGMPQDRRWARSRRRRPRDRASTERTSAPTCC